MTLHSLGAGSIESGTAPRWISEDEAEAVVWLASLDEPVTSARVGEDLAQDHHKRTYTACVTRGYAMLRTLASFGLAARVGRNAWAITERGRIVAALHMAQRPGMMAAFFDED